MPTRKAAPKPICPLTKAPATCGIDKFIVEMQKLRDEVKELRKAIPQTAQLEQYAEIARQLAPMVEAVQAIREMLAKSLDVVLANETMQGFGRRLTDYETRLGAVERGQKNG
jgi:hypothetical protein